ncbi:DUF779 domain-containing protein [Streptomyces spiramenti]|uniref:DUF779 domain-containing protein n=1 Tax=Streptomyces spiramenti TaxID=2720606 RepID=A0ABX1AN10_9ACTN|nr:DUF779 domain-containing protein [Streptomyces spiramenti]NJP68483.1 DUF779 domain-containing protein [Streptomyces spiramenti]
MTTPAGDFESEGGALAPSAQPPRAGAPTNEPGGAPPERVRLTDAGAELVARLVEAHGPLMFHQSGGCCDGSSPMCYPRGEFRVGASDVLLETLPDGTPFWMSADQYAYWKHTVLTVDVVPGRGSGFSLEAPEGVRFLLRSRVMTDEENARAEASPPLSTGTEVTP